MGDSFAKKTLKWLRDLSDGTIGRQLEALVTKGVRVVKVQEGLLLCDFTIHNSLSDENGNWHVGAIATLIDIIGAIAAYSYISNDILTLNFTISYYSTATVQEEVEVEAKVLGKKEILPSVIVTVKKKENGELVALGKLWLAPAKINARHKASKL